MKKLVVDASVCLKWVFEEEDSDKARILLKRYKEDKYILVAPDLWEYEIVNALATAVRRKKINPSKSRLFLKLILKGKPETIPLSTILPKCLENAQKYEISGYDSAYITLAKENKIFLISSDDKLVEKVADKNLAVLLKDYLV